VGTFNLFAQQRAGDNQFTNFGSNPPGVVPQSNVDAYVNPLGGNGGLQKQKAGYYSQQTMFPNLTADMFQFLQNNVGQGATPFNLSAILPSSGQASAPGSLTAGPNPILQGLMDYYSGGKPSASPGAAGLDSMSKTGNPIDQMPAWNAMIQAQQRNTDQNAAALREQYAFAGTLKGSPFAQGIQDFYNQNTLNQNAMLTQATAQAGENAANRQLSASSTIQQNAQQLGQLFQGMDQNAINSMLQEFIRTRPEYSPLLNAMFAASTSYAPTLNDQGLGHQFASSLLENLGASLGGASATGSAGGVGYKI
jgi:osmotically-inducible protein OsmY